MRALPRLESYRRDLPYSYAPGLFPAMNALEFAPERCLRLLLSEKSRESEGAAKLLERCEEAGIRIEYADRVLRSLSHKDNCYAAMVYRKEEQQPGEASDHLVLHRPSDCGNMGTMMRTALGMAYEDIAILEEAADPDDPRTVRASMGALFALRICRFPEAHAYLERYAPGRQLFPFMLTGSTDLEQVFPHSLPMSLIFGNEATGLPEGFSEIGTPVRIPHSDRIDSLNLAVAAGIGMYTLRARRKEEG